MKVVVYNLGCKVNQYESDGIMTRLLELGYTVDANLGVADAYIINTCAVTNEAERKSRQTIARCRRYNANAIIIVCGCASQNDAAPFLNKCGVTYISGVAGKASIPQMLAERGVHVDELPIQYEDDLSPSVNRTRAYVKVQDGCNNYCSYCIIPYLRGRSRSRALSSVVQECERLAKDTKEIVITGINLSAYGDDIKSSLAKLIESMRSIDARIRLGSLEVNVIDDMLLQSCRELNKFCPQFHLSLQSGSNNVLRKMNRHYTTEEYLNKVNHIRRYFPKAAITTDIICGFPTESEDEFNETIDFVSRVGFADIHIFAYSKREGTMASQYEPLPNNTVKMRCKALEQIREVSRNQFLNSFQDAELEILVESDGGYSREYIRVDGIVGNSGDIVNIIYNR